MKIVQIGDRDMIGNKFNGHDLHRYLREQNHEAYHLVREKSSDDPYTFVYQRRSSKESFTKNLFYEPLITEADVLHFH